jgi:hypothetical protein
MSDSPDPDPFYIGYLPQAPAVTARFVRRTIAVIVGGALAIAGIAAFALPYFGTGEFDFGRPLRGTVIRREGRQLLEVTSGAAIRMRGQPESAPVALGRFTLRGEIVDSKCYFGVMNPAEGRAHRACAELCLRGGVPAVFVARDQTGAVAHFLIADRDGKPLNAILLSYAGLTVEVSGEVIRRGNWLILQPEISSLRTG